MSKYEKPIPMSMLARRLAGAALAATLIPGALVAGAVLVPAIASAAVDSDGDGLTDDFELRGLTDPQNPDSDRDFLNDGDELHKYYTGPVNQDSDSDGVSDGDEVLRYHTDPNYNPVRIPTATGWKPPRNSTTTLILRTPTPTVTDSSTARRCGPTTRDR